MQERSEMSAASKEKGLVKDTAQGWNKRDGRLLQAIERRQAERIHSLMRAGVDVTKIDPKTGLTAIHVAVMGGQMSIVNLVFGSEHFNVNARDAIDRTALHCAVQHARSDVTRRIIECQPDMLLVDRAKKSALHYACEGGHLGCVQLLLECNSPVYLKDQDGRGPLSYAAERGQASICRLLLEKNAGINEVDNEHRTSLMVAANANHAAVCDYLIQRGADVTLVDKQGRTALDIARLSGERNEVIKLLERNDISQRARRPSVTRAIITSESSDVQVDGRTYSGGVENTAELVEETPRTESNETGSSITDQQSLMTISVVVDVLPSPEDCVSSPDDDSEVCPSSTPLVMHSDVDSGEPEIEAEFRQNLSHLLERGECADEDEQRGDFRLSLIVEDNMDPGLDLIGAVPDENKLESPDQTICQHSQDDVVVESVDADVERFNVEQMRALIQQLENENSALRMNAEDLALRRQSLESAKRRLEVEFSRLADEQRSMNRGVIELLDAVRNVHGRLTTTTASSQLDNGGSERRHEELLAKDTEMAHRERDAVDCASSNIDSEVVQGRRTTMELMDTSMATIQTMILNLAKSEWLDLGRPEIETRLSDEVNGSTSAALVASPLIQLMRLENATLKTRLHEVAADERRMRRQLDEVERLMSLVDEFKDENRALIDEFARLKATMIVIERDETEELERFANAFRELKDENESLRYRLEELTTRQYRQDGPDSGKRALGRTGLYEEPLAFIGDAEPKTSTPRLTRAVGSSTIPNADEVDAPGNASIQNVDGATESALTSPTRINRVTELEEENRRLLAELEHMRHAIDRQTIAMLEMDEDLRRAARRTNDGQPEGGESRHRLEKADSKRTAYINVAGGCIKDEITSADPISERQGRWQDSRIGELQKLVDSMSKTIQTKNAEIKELRGAVELMRGQVYKDVDNSQVNGDSDVTSGTTVPIIATSGVNHLTMQKLSSTGSKTKVTSSRSPLSPTIAAVTASSSQNIHSLRQHSAESGIARSGRYSNSMRDETTYVSETDLAVATVGYSVDAGTGELGDDFESELSFDLARAMIDCQKVVQENRRLRRELAELRVAVPGAQSSKSTTATVTHTRGQSGSGDRRNGGTAVDGDELVRENQKLRTYADELQSEIDALKRTVKEQSIYLSSVTSSVTRPDVDSDNRVVELPVASSPRRDGLLVGVEEQTDSNSGEIDGIIRSADSGNCQSRSQREDGTKERSRAGERLTLAGSPKAARKSQIGSSDDWPPLEDVVQLLRRQNASLLEELETTKRGWTEYESFADEYRDKLMTEIERLRNDHQMAAASVDDADNMRSESELWRSREKITRIRNVMDEYRTAASQFYDTISRQLNIDGVPVTTTGRETLGVISNEEEADAKNLYDFRSLLQRCLDTSSRMLQNNVGLTKVNLILNQQSDDQVTDEDVKMDMAEKRRSASAGVKAIGQGRNFAETERSCYDQRKLRHTSEVEADGGLLEVANLTIDHLQTRLTVVETQLVAARRDNDRLRRVVDEYGNGIRRADMATVAAQSGTDGKCEEVGTQTTGPRTHHDPSNESKQQAAQSAVTAVEGPQLDADYEEQLLTEIEELRAELRGTQRRLREREYELEETRDDLLELNERICRQADEEIRRKANQEQCDKEGDANKSITTDTDPTLIPTHVDAPTQDSYEQRLKTVTKERDQLNEKLAELQRSQLDSERRELQRQEEMEAFNAMQEKIAAENGRLNAELVRCSVERLRAEDRCKKLESDCVAFEELSNEMTERWQRLNTEFMRLKASPSSLPSKLSQAGALARPKTDVCEPRRQTNDEEPDQQVTAATSQEYREVVEENARLKMVLEMERLKNFSASGAGIGYTRVPKADDQTDTAVDTSSVLRTGRSVDWRSMEDTSESTRGKEPRLSRASENDLDRLTSTGDGRLPLSTAHEQRIAFDDVVLRRGSLPSVGPSHHLTRPESTTKCTVVSVQRAASLRATDHTDADKTDAAHRNAHVQSGRLLAETTEICSTLVETLFRLVERPVEVASFQKPIIDVDDDSESRVTASTSWEDANTTQRRPELSSSSSSLSWLYSLRTALEEHNRRLCQLLRSTINDEIVPSSSTTTSPEATLSSQTSSSTTVAVESGQDHGAGEGIKSRIQDGNARLTRLAATVEELIARLPSTDVVEMMTSSASDLKIRADVGNGDGEHETFASLRAKISDLERKLKENENRRLDAVCTYRRHLLSAVQGVMDPKVKEALLCIVKTRLRDPDN